MAYLTHQSPDFFDVVASATVFLDNALLFFAAFRLFAGKFLVRAVKGSALSAFTAAVFAIFCVVVRALAHGTIPSSEVVAAAVIVAFGLVVGFAGFFVLNFCFIWLVSGVLVNHP